MANNPEYRHHCEILFGLKPSEKDSFLDPLGTESFRAVGKGLLTSRKRCRRLWEDKNDPSRFLGEGITFKAKLIGILEVSEARGDKMCQDALNDLKTAIRAAGEHKQRITINISIDGLRLRDEKTGDCLYHHPVHKISFIAQDMSDSRAFGYIFGSPDTGHRFFGIKTDKTASQVVISMRDLFQVVFELKKKEIEMTKHHTDQHHLKYGSTGYMDSIHLSKDDNEFDKTKGKYSQLLKSRGFTSKATELVGSTNARAPGSEAIADLLDLEQGISQLDKITSSDPFGSLKSDPYDLFDDSFPSNAIRQHSLEKTTISVAEHQQHEETADSFFVPPASATRTSFFHQFSPGPEKPRVDEPGWFERETESLFEDTTTGTNNIAEATSSPIPLGTQPVPSDSDQVEDKKSPIKTDLFTELDPLGTGRVKPYIDKKDFFQELKNPPKKVLKEMIGSDAAASEPQGSASYFATNFLEEKNTGRKGDLTLSESTTSADFRESNLNLKYLKIDPFSDDDPFEKTDPFQEDNFNSMAVGFTPLFGAKSSLEGIFDGKSLWETRKATDRDRPETIQNRKSPTNFPLLSSGILRVSLPPKKTEETTTIGPGPSSTSDSLVPSETNSPDGLTSVRRKTLNRSLRQKTIGGEMSPAQEEPFIKCKLTGFDSKIGLTQKTPFKNQFYITEQSTLPTSARHDKMDRKGFSSVEMLDATTPDPPPRAKTALFSIKPPPLPPKKTNQPSLKPPARPPSLDDHVSHYDYLQQKETSSSSTTSGLVFQPKEELKCMKLKKPLCTGKESPPAKDRRKQNSLSEFPVLLPPPGGNRKSSSDVSKMLAGKKLEANSKANSTDGSDGSVLNIKLTQLDGSGLETLAVSLGISSENMYAMTLQDLTKMIAEKYLTSSRTNQETSLNSSNGNGFEVDFESNFSRPDATESSTSTSTYDKYAVFKELIESEQHNKRNENEESEKQRGGDADTEVKGTEAPQTGGGTKEVEELEEEEDKYEALRQLSLTTPHHHADDFGNEDDGLGRFEQGPQETSRSGQENDFCANSLEFKSVAEKEAEATRSKNQTPNHQQQSTASLDSNVPRTAQVMTGWASKADWQTSEPGPEGAKDLDFPTESQLFPLVDQFSDENRPNRSNGSNATRDNWATFEKADFHEGTTAKAPSNNFNETANSPFSSDGKEEEKEMTFRWNQNAFREKEGKHKDVPWNDEDEDEEEEDDEEDESWDEYSPKESLYSDESSHEDHSPETLRSNDREEKLSWNTRRRPSKDRGELASWGEKTKSSRWGRARDKWQEESEDDFEDTWRKQRQKTGSYESDKNNFWMGNRGEYRGDYNKRSEWCNNWCEDWDESDRHSHCYGNRRKRSESDNEYRKRFDSDTSDKECIWTFQKNFSDSQGGGGGGGGGGGSSSSRSGKQKHKQKQQQKQYHSLVRFFKDCPEYCPESRSKPRRGTISQKRPSSASESKRANYEKMFSSSEYPCKGGDESSYAGKRHAEKEEFFRCQQHGCKDSRYRGEVEFRRHHHGSTHDSRTSGHQPRTTDNRGFGQEESSAYAPAVAAAAAATAVGRRGESSIENYRYAESHNEKKYKYSKGEFDGDHFHQFGGEGENFREKEKPRTSNQAPQQQQLTKSPEPPKTNQWAMTNDKTEEAFLPAVNSEKDNFTNFTAIEAMSTTTTKATAKTTGTTAAATMKTTAENATERPQSSSAKSQTTKMAPQGRQDSSSLLRKSDSINIFSRDKDPFEGDDFFSSVS